MRTIALPFLRHFTHAVVVQLHTQRDGFHTGRNRINPCGKAVVFAPVLAVHHALDARLRIDTPFTALDKVVKIGGMRKFQGMRAADAALGGELHRRGGTDFLAVGKVVFIGERLRPGDGIVLNQNPMIERFHVVNQTAFQHFLLNEA